MLSESLSLPAVDDSIGVKYINNVSEENNSALSGYYMMRAANGSLISMYCDPSFLSCSQIAHVNSSAPSGNYTIQTPNSSLISVYCDIGHE